MSSSLTLTTTPECKHVPGWSSSCPISLSPLAALLLELTKMYVPVSPSQAILEVLAPPSVGVERCELCVPVSSTCPAPSKQKTLCQLNLNTICLQRMAGIYELAMYYTFQPFQTHSSSSGPSPLFTHCFYVLEISSTCRQPFLSKRVQSQINMSNYNNKQTFRSTYVRCLAWSKACSFTSRHLYIEFLVQKNELLLNFFS
jgi:hypothetical protein